MTANQGGPLGGFENGGEHTQGGGFAGAVGSQQSIDLPWLAAEADVLHGADFAALFVLEELGQPTSFDQASLLYSNERSADLSGMNTLTVDCKFTAIEVRKIRKTET